MSFREMGYRVSTALYTQAQSWGFWTAKAVPAPSLCYDSNGWLEEYKEVNAARYCDAADAIIAGRLRLFSRNDVNLGRLPNWNRDPLTGITAPLSFGKKLNYRDAKLVGDIKYLWEPNRHLQLVTIAQAYFLTRDRRYLDGLAAKLNSWFEQCPYLKGPNWANSLELAIRLINWSLVWRLIGGAASPLFSDERGHILRERWLTSVYQHMHFIRGNLSRFSSANNHLVGEAAGLFLATVTWPFWEVSRSWQDFAQKILVREALLQNASDGVNKEQAIWYQQFVLDFLLLAALARCADSIEFPKAYWDRVEAMLEYIASVMDVAGGIPMIGDADDGCVVRLSQEEEFCPYRSLLATGAVLFSRQDFKVKAGRLDDKTRWLLDKRAESEFSAIEIQAPVLPIRRAFPEGGYYILGCHFETPKEIRLVVDAGPLGYRSIAAHGHADALAFTLSIGGIEFLIDPGTYSYHGDTEWRNYFRGTSAHNTVQIDGLNQSTIGGNFMWLQKANASCEVWQPDENIDLFLGKHDGYLRLPDPVIHKREIRLSKSDRIILVTDVIQCKASHAIEHFWHFAEDCEVSLNGHEVLATNGGTAIRLNTGDGISKPEKRRAEVSPPAGWVSRRYGHKVPTTTIVVRSEIKGTTSLTTKIRCHSF